MPPMPLNVSAAVVGGVRLHAPLTSEAKTQSSQPQLTIPTTAWNPQTTPKNLTNQNLPTIP